MADANQIENHLRSISKLKKESCPENELDDLSGDPHLGAGSPGLYPGQGIHRRIYLRDGGPGYWPSSEPFFVMHGWMHQPQVSPPDMVGLFRFELELDDQLLQEDYCLSIPYPPGQPKWLDRYWIYNFPKGLTGDHTFTLHYFGPRCTYGGNEYCLPPYRNEVVEVETITVLVHFVF